MANRPKIHFAAGADPKLGAYVSSACGALHERWTLATPMSGAVQNVTCGACRRTQVFKTTEAQPTGSPPDYGAPAGRPRAETGPPVFDYEHHVRPADERPIVPIYTEDDG